ncbi:C40 family peptidase [bacterium]|nr:C40 family peptidase [bacterium]
MTRHVLVIAACLLLTGCTATRSIFGISPELSEESGTEASDGSGYEAGEGALEQGAPSVYERLDTALRLELEGWHGTPHVWGGNTKKGVDCSGLVQQIFADVLDLETPRTTGELILEGRRVSKSKLKTGDLVFFSPESKKAGHVGIYLSQGDFAHASSSKGVMTSKLTNPYWKKYYETGRRLISDESMLFTALRRIEQRQELARYLQTSTN